MLDLEFDHVYLIEDGEVKSERTGMHGPDVMFYESDLKHWYISDGWSLMNGYSGQYSYSGPVMHDSEFIGGQLERDILEQPGYYVIGAAYWNNSDEVEGWYIAYKEL